MFQRQSHSPVSRSTKPKIYFLVLRMVFNTSKACLK